MICEIGNFTLKDLLFFLLAQFEKYLKLKFKMEQNAAKLIDLTTMLTISH